MLEIFLVTILIVAFLWNLKRIKLKHQLPLPPGPIRWPILGSLPQMIWENPTYGHLQLSGLAKKYGGIMSIGFGVHYAVVVSNYEIMMDLFKRPEACLERFRFEFFEQRNNFKNLGLVWACGDVWKDQRKITLKLLKTFGFGKKQTMNETIQAEVNDLVSHIQEVIEPLNGIWNVDLNRLSICAINIIWASVGGYRFDPKSEKLKRNLDLQLRIFESLGPQNLLAAFPFLKVFPELSGFREQDRIQKECREFTLELIEDAKERRHDQIEASSFVEAYLDEIEKDKNNPNSSTTVEQLVLILMDLFLAGSDTTSTVIYWMLLYLGLYSNVQKKARAEIFAFTHGSSKPIPSSEMLNLPYVRAIILETMRHSPFLFAGAARRVTQDTECAGYRIPKGTLLFHNFNSIFHDKIFWGDPEIFRPERFLLKDGTMNPVTAERVIQFGVGPRICPGENMAMISIFMITTELLRKFSFDIIIGMEPTLEPSTPSLTLKPKPFVLKVISI